MQRGTWNWLKNGLDYLSRSPLSKRRLKRAANAKRMMHVEPLESRHLMATVTIGWGSDTWEDVSGSPNVWFHVNRDGDLSQPLTVYYKTDGSATNDLIITPGADYYMSGVITIAAGHSSAILSSSAFSDEISEPTESVKVTILENDNYTVGTEKVATGYIYDNDEDWDGKALYDETIVCSACMQQCPNCPSLHLPVGYSINTANGELIVQSYVAGLIYSSWGATGLARMEVTTGFDGAANYVPSIKVNGTFNYVSQFDTDDSFSTANIVEGLEYDFGYVVDTPVDSGVYSWQIVVKEDDPVMPITTAMAGKSKVRNYANSEFGIGWVMPGLDKLKVQSDGALWLRGDANAFWFEKDPLTGEFTRDKADFEYSSLEENTDGSYTLTTKYGEVLEFNSGGVLQTRTDRNGNETSYSYSSGKIQSITDPSGRTTTFGYTSGLVSSITDSFGRVTTLAYSGGTISSITSPDPDGSGPLEAGETSFTYGGTDKYMASFTTPEGQTTSFNYSNFSSPVKTAVKAYMVSEVIHADSSTETYVPQFGSTTDRAAVGGSSLYPITRDMVRAIYTNELGNRWEIQSNEFGKSLKVLDPKGNLTIYDYDDFRMTAVHQPIHEDHEAIEYALTSYGYDTLGNLMAVSHPDSSGEYWTYGVNSQVDSFTNRLGDLTLFGLDTFGNPLSMRQVIGANDIGGIESNDIVTVFTYTSLTSSTTDRRAGLVESITDPLGRLTSVSYVGADSISSIIYADGEADETEVTFGYDANYNLAWSEDELGRRTDYIFDMLDRMTEMTLPDPDNSGPLARPVYEYKHNKNNFVTAIIDSLGRKTIYTYTNRLDTATASLTDYSLGSTLATTSYTYDVHRRVTDISDALGRNTEYSYDKVDNNIEVALPSPGGMGAQPTYTATVDAAGRIRSVTDPMSALTLYDLDTWNEVFTTLPDPDGAGVATAATTHDVFDALGNLLSRTDEIGRTTSYTYDELGRLTSVTTPDPDGSGGASAGTTTYEYDAASNLRFVTDPLGNVTEYVYDNHNRVIAVILPDPDGTGGVASPEYEYTYDDAGQLLTATDPLGRVTSYTYDALGRTITVTAPDPDGAGAIAAPVTTYAYDSEGRVISVTNANGFTTSYEYDALDNLTEVTEADPDGAGPLAAPVTSYTYDAMGQLLSITDPLGRVTTIEYDNLGRQTEITLPDPDGAGGASAPVTTFTYDAVGNLLTQTDALSNVTTFTYDKLRRLTTKTQADPDGAGALTSPVWNYQYDAAGQLTAEIDPLGNKTSYGYDGLGRVTSKTLPDIDGSGSRYAPRYAYAYDAAGNLTSETNPLGNVTSYAYDNLYRLLSITQPDPDGAGGASAPVTAYTYDAASQRSTKTDVLGGVTSYAYDNLGQLTGVTLPDPDDGGSLASPQWSYQYDAVGNRTHVTDALGGVTVYAFDRLNRLTSRTDPDPDAGGALTSPVTSFTYDAAGQQLSVTDPENRLTSFDYDNLGRQTKVTAPDPDGAGSLARPYTTFAYDAMGNLTSVTDPLGHTTSHTYDKLYRQLTTTDAKSGVTTYTYDKLGQMLTLDDSVGNTTTWQYDAVGNITSETNELGNARTFSYDLAGNMLRKTDRRGTVTRYTYDNLGRETSELWMSGASTDASVGVSTTTQGGPVDEVQRVGLNASMSLYGGTFTLTYSGQTTTSMAYNASAATVEAALVALSNIGTGDVVVTKTLNSGTQQEWKVEFKNGLAGTNVSQITVNSSAYGFMSVTKTEATDVQGNTSAPEVQVVTLSNAPSGTFTLGFAGEVTAPIAFNASAATVESALEALAGIDNVTVTGSAGGPWTVSFGGTQSGVNVPQLEGDASKSYSGSVSQTLAYTYNAAGQLASVDDAWADYDYTYDKLGRLTSEVQSITGLTPDITLQNQYDAMGNRTQLQALIGSTSDLKNTYVYNALSQLTSVRQQGVSGGNTVAQKRADFTYDASGLFESITRYADVSGTNDVVTSTYSYDGMGRLSSLNHLDTSLTGIAGYDFTYDAASRITSVDSLIDGLTNYTHDNTDQLTAADHTGATDETYTYDANGNRTMSGYSIGSNNRLLSDGTYNYTYDNEGNRLSKQKISTGEREEYQWDNRNRLTQVTFKNSMGTVVKTVTESYDAFNRWVRRQVDSDGPGPNAATNTFFSYDGDQVLLEFDGTAAGDVSHRYLWGEMVDQLLADEQVTTTSSAGSVLWTLGDQIGSLRDLATYNSGTDTTTIANHRVYDSYGNLTYETNSSVDEIFGFTGRAYDDSTKLQNNLNRWYDSATGQWMSEDPIGFAGGDENLRRYVGNHPTYATDPLGLAEELGSEELAIVKDLQQRLEKLRKEDWEAYLRRVHPDGKAPLVFSGPAYFEDDNPEIKKLRDELDKLIRGKKLPGESSCPTITQAELDQKALNELVAAQRAVELEIELVRLRQEQELRNNAISLLGPTALGFPGVGLGGPTLGTGFGAASRAAARGAATTTRVAPPVTKPGGLGYPGSMQTAPPAPKPGGLGHPGSMQTAPPVPKPGGLGHPGSMQTVPPAPKPGGLGHPGSMQTAPNCAPPNGSRSASDILMPGGQQVGRPGTSAGIRRVNGGLKAAQEMFDELAAGGKDVTPPGHPGKLVELPNGGRVGLRPVSGSTDKSPSLDVKIPNIPVIKIHFEP